MSHYFRISALLRDMDGNEWRSKLPSHSESQSILAALSNNFSLPTVVTSGDGSAMKDESGGREEGERREGEKEERGGVEKGSGVAMSARNDPPVEQEVEESHDGEEESGRDGEEKGDDMKLIGNDVQQMEGANDETVDSEGSEGDREGEEGSSGVEEGENGGYDKQPYSSVPVVTSTAATPGHYSTKVHQTETKPCV